MSTEAPRSGHRRINGPSGDPAVRLDRVPPHSLEAELAVLGAVLVQNERLDEVAERLGPEDFYRDAHRRLFRHMLALAERHEALDLLTLRESLTRSGELETIGGPAYITALVDGMPHAANVAHYAGIVREKATRRRVIAAATKALTLAYEPNEEIPQVLDRAQQELLEIAADRTAGAFVSGPELVSDLLPMLDQLHAQPRAVTGVASGFTDLDRLTRGWQPSDLILLAARPAMGKTALALRLALQAATVGGQHVAFFSLEMARRQLGLRVLSSEAQIDGQRVMTGRTRDAEWPRVTQALETIAAARLHITDASADELPVSAMRAMARRLKAQQGLGLIVIDYLQLMHGTGRHENRNLEIGQISRALKGLAKDLDVPVLALAQLNRSLEARANKRPMLSDLRESGALEQDADLVLFLSRDEVYNEHTSDRGVAEVHIAKHRNGPIGTVRLGFEKETMRFWNLTPEIAA